jgi:hypothetical protein|nr:Eco57I restriction-modification methylase domain-containing protein [Kofleriaceae bacterium]
MIPGVVYTPPALAAAMVKRALDPLDVGGGHIPTVCDPAVGEGAFALAAIDYLAARTGASPRTIAEDCVFGADIDTHAITRAIDSIARATGARPERLADHLVVADALAHAWPCTFDAVIANPPYIRQELLDNKRALRGYEVFDGTADLYVYFVELAHRLLAPHGRWCVVVPNKWLTAAYAAALRRFLAARGTLEGVVDLGRLERAAAPFAADAFPCVAWGTATRSRAPLRAGIAGALADVIADPPVRDRARFAAAPWHLDSDDDGALIARLAARFPPLRDVAPRPQRGVVTGCNAAFVVDGATRARLVDADPAAAPWIRPLLKGRDVRPLRAAPADRYVLAIDRGTPLDALPRAIHAHLARFRARLEPGSGRKPGSYAWYQLQDPLGDRATARPRLFYQDIQTQPACCLDAAGDFVPDTTVWALPSGDPVLLAILNSTFYMWYARRRFPPALNGAVRPKLAYASELPIAQPAAAARARIAELVTAGDRAALDAAVLDAYELTAADRRLLSAPASPA